jgi:hypothetical protein
MVDRKQSIHDNHTRLISLKPQLIGLDGIVLSTAEANLRNNKGVVFSQPDNLMFDPSTKTLYNIEYKTHHTNSQSLHAKDQLKRAHLKLKSIFGDWHITDLYITDNYRVEIVK